MPVRVTIRAHNRVQEPAHLKRIDGIDFFLREYR